MKNYLLLIAKQILFWLGVFAFARIVFFIYYAADLRLENVGFIDVFPTLFHAWKLDLSTICYILIVPFFILLAQMFFKKNWAPKVIWFYTIAILLVFFLIMGGELGIYGEWKSKMNYKALLYLQNPSEVFQSTSGGQFFLLAVIVTLSVVLWSFLSYRWFVKKTVLTRVQWYYILPYFLVSPVLIFLGMRGGWKEIPVQQSIVYFSNNRTLNDIAVNSAWNLIHSTTSSRGVIEKNPFVTMSQEAAEAIVNELLFVEKDTTISILTTDRPNIVLLILESWSGDLIESLGGIAGVTPNFHEMEKEGVLFTEHYSGGKRSQQGLAGILCGHPGLPKITISDFPEKSRKLPSITKHLNEAGYKTSFYFGGQLVYGNLRSLVMFTEFHKIMEGEDFSKNLHWGRLGVHDEDVLAFHIKELNQETEPFFSTVFTLSSHSPFDQPLQNALDWDLPQMDYLNSVFYTDKCIGEYLEQAKKEDWYDNTLFILVADHGRVSHIPRDYYSFEHIHVPLLFYGEVIKPEFRGQTVDRLMTQADLPVTVLKQLNLNTSLFRWSRNIFNPYTQNFVFVEEQNGPGYKRPEGSFVYNFDSKSFMNKNFPKNEADSLRLFNEGAAYLQVLFQEFIEF